MFRMHFSGLGTAGGIINYLSLSSRLIFGRAFYSAHVSPHKGGAAFNAAPLRGGHPVSISRLNIAPKRVLRASVHALSSRKRCPTSIHGPRAQPDVASAGEGLRS